MHRFSIAFLGFILLLVSCGNASGNTATERTAESVTEAVESIPEILDSKEQAQKNGTFVFVKDHLKMFLPTYYTSPVQNEHYINFDIVYAETDVARIGIASDVLSTSVSDAKEESLKQFHEEIIGALGGEIISSVKVTPSKDLAEDISYRNVLKTPNDQVDQMLLYDIYSVKQDRFWLLLLATAKGNKYAYDADFEEILSTLKYTTEEDTDLASLENGSLGYTSDLSDRSEAKIEENSSSDIRKAIDSYEAFFDEYIAFMEKYKRNPSDLQLLADYMKFVDQYEKTMNELDALNDADMSAADREYYLDAMNRINKKLLNAMD